MASGTEHSARIAVCVSGHLRHLQRGADSFKRHVIEPNHDCGFDFFVHTWDCMDWRRETDGFLDPDVIRDALNPCHELVIERAIEWDTSRFHHLIRPGDVKKGTMGEHILGMYYKIEQCNELPKRYMKDGVSYDIIMRWRTDIGFRNDLVLDHDMISSCKNMLYVPKHDHFGDGWVTDVFAFSDPENMNRYSSVYSEIDSLVEQCGVFRPEPLLSKQLSRSGVSVCMLDLEWEVLY